MEGKRIYVALSYDYLLPFTSKSRPKRKKKPRDPDESEDQRYDLSKSNDMRNFSSSKQGCLRTLLLSRLSYVDLCF